MLQHLETIYHDVTVYSYTGGQYQQTFKVEFLSDSSISPSQSTGNIVTRERSGNPGYIIGRPVLFGSGFYNSSVSSTTPEYILEYVNGLAISTPFLAYDMNDPASFGLSMCPSLSQLNEMTKHYIKFGYDITTGCVLNLNRSQLNDICCQGASCTTTSISPFSNPTTGIPYFFNFSSG